VRHREAQHDAILVSVSRAAVGGGNYVLEHMRVPRCGIRGEEDLPEYEVRMSHEVRYAFEHAPGLEDKRWKGDLREVHADSRVGWSPEGVGVGYWSVAAGSEKGAHLSWEMRDNIIEPSSSSLWTGGG